MQASVAEVKAGLSEFIRRVEDGEEIIITRHGQPVARLSRPKPKGKRRLGTLKGVATLNPGWDEPIPLEDYSVVTSRTAESDR